MLFIIVFRLAHQEQLLIQNCEILKQSNKTYVLLFHINIIIYYLLLFYYCIFDRHETPLRRALRNEDKKETNNNNENIRNIYIYI